MILSFALPLVVLGASSVLADVPALTVETYSSETAGKAVFIKFFAPWCGHCKSMAPAWAKLAEEWAGKPDTLVAEVNCDVENELCDSMGVDGFPSIKYGDPNALEDYEGGRDYESLAAFAQENLKGVCAPNKTENCSEEKKLQLDAFMAMPSSDLLELIQDQENRIKAAEEKFEADLDALQNKFQEISKEKDEAIAKAKASGLSLMKSVSVFKAKTNDIAGDEL